MEKTIAGKPATGKYSEIINRIYKQALKLAKTSESKYKYASCGDIWQG